MKNKKVTYAMFGVVILVWGVVLFRFLSFSESGDTQEIPLYSNIEIAEDVNVDTFSLLLHYKDPFFKNSIKNNFVKKKKITKPEKTVKKEKKELVIWPRISYKGVISSKNTSIGVVIINDKQYLMSAKQEQNGVLVTDLFSDSLYVSFKGESKTILKQ